MCERFWMVFADEFMVKASKRHATRDSAVAEAKRLAEAERGKAFFVAAFTGVAQATDVTWTELERNREGR